MCLVSAKEVAGVQNSIHPRGELRLPYLALSGKIPLALLERALAQYCCSKPATKPKAQGPKTNFLESDASLVRSSSLVPSLFKACQ